MSQRSDLFQRIQTDAVRMFVVTGTIAPEYRITDDYLRRSGGVPLVPSVTAQWQQLYDAARAEIAMHRASLTEAYKRIAALQAEVDRLTPKGGMSATALRF